MRKSEELSKNIEDMRNQLMDLVDEDFRIHEIVRQLDYFHLDTRLDAEGMIEFRCEHGVIPIGGRVKENEMIYALAIMSFYGILYYKCKKIIRRIRKKGIYSKDRFFAFKYGKSNKKTSKERKPIQLIKYY